jgi:hypothetical protein
LAKRDHREYMGISPQRRDDWEFAFQVRPVVVELDGRRLTISPQEAHFLLAELGRLPRARHQAAEETAAELMHGLAAGCAVSLDDDGRRCVLRAIEGVRVRGKLSAGLAELRLSLLHSAEPVV